MGTNGKSSGGFVVGLLIGGAAGAAAALLMAPQSGKETRAQIKQQAVEVEHKAEKVIADVRVKAKDEMTKGRAKLADVRVKAKDELTKGKAILAEGPGQLAHAWQETKRVAVTTAQAPAEAMSPMQGATCETQEVCTAG